MKRSTCLIMILAACTSAPPDPAASFAALEETLLSAETLSAAYEVTAEGAFDARLSGSLQIASGNRVRLEGTGSFGTQAVEMLLVSDGTTMRMTVNGIAADLETPTALTEAILIGMTRMGILHNLARLVGNEPPDHGEGGVRDWVQVTDIGVGKEANDPELTFGLVVSGEVSGEASLLVSAESNMPVVRTQTVQFPNGKMRVKENYTSVRLSLAFDDEAFDVAGTIPGGG